MCWVLHRLKVLQNSEKVKQGECRIVDFSVVADIAPPSHLKENDDGEGTTSVEKRGRPWAYEGSAHDGWYCQRVCWCSLYGIRNKQAERSRSGLRCWTKRRRAELHRERKQNDDATSLVSDPCRERRKNRKERGKGRYIGRARASDPRAP